MESLNCDFCKKPTFICSCGSDWNSFGDLKNLARTDTKHNLTCSNLVINTMTVNFNFNQCIDIELLNEGIPKNVEIKYNPGSKKSKEKKKKGSDSFYNSFEIKISVIDEEQISCVSVFLFDNGKVKMAGAKTIKTINIVIDEIIELINYVPDVIDDPEDFFPENVRISMICSDFKIKPIKDDPIGWCLKQEELKNILVHEYQVSATFSSLSKYPGINCKYPSVIEPGKNVSLLIFRSGSIIITGGKHAKDLLNSFNFIVDVITKNANRLFYYDINEEIKQKKKQQKIK